MSQRPIISILHPTARVRSFPSFPGGWKGACEQFGRAAFHPEDIEYVLIVHESNWAEFWETYGGPPPQADKMHAIPHVGEVFGTFYVVQNHGRSCVVDQINTGAAAASGSLFVGIMDDLVAPIGWDEKLLNLLHPVRDVFNSGAVPALHSALDEEWVIDLTGEKTDWIVYSALTRKRYERYGYVLYPEFESMYSDNYYSHVAHRDGVVIDGRGLGFQHNHPSNGRSENDAVYGQQNNPDAYIEGYGLLQKLITGKQIIAVVMPGEEFSAAWVGNAFDLQWNLAANYIIQPHMGFSSMVHATRYDLHNEVLDSKPKPDLILWWDDDNTPTYAHVERLLRDLEEHPEIDGIVGWCYCENKKGGAKKPEDWTMSVGMLGGVDDFGGHEGLRFTSDDMNRMGPIISARDLQAKYGPGYGFWSGFPCVLLRYETAVRMGRDCFVPILHPKAKRGFTGEDAAFFWRARSLGVNMAVDLRCKIPHLKFGAFEPEFAPAVKPEPAAELVNAM